MNFFEGVRFQSSKQRFLQILLYILHKVFSLNTPCFDHIKAITYNQQCNAVNRDLYHVTLMILRFLPHYVAAENVFSLENTLLLKLFFFLLNKIAPFFFVVDFNLTFQQYFM